MATAQAYVCTRDIFVCILRSSFLLSFSFFLDGAREYTDQGSLFTLAVGAAARAALPKRLLRRIFQKGDPAIGSLREIVHERRVGAWRAVVIQGSAKVLKEKKNPVWFTSASCRGTPPDCPARRRITREKLRRWLMMVEGGALNRCLASLTQPPRETNQQPPPGRKFPRPTRQEKETKKKGGDPAGIQWVLGMLNADYPVPEDEYDGQE